MWEKSKIPGPFRVFVIRMWAENVRERKGYNDEPLDFAEYFTKYKFWLKEVFKHDREKS